MESGLTNPPALIGTGAAKGVTSFPVSLAAWLLSGFGWGGYEPFTVLELGNG